MSEQTFDANSKIVLQKRDFGGKRPWSVALWHGDRCEESYACATLACAFAVMSCLSANIEPPKNYYKIRG